MGDVYGRCEWEECIGVCMEGMHWCEWEVYIRGVNGRCEWRCELEM